MIASLLSVVTASRSCSGVSYPAAAAVAMTITAPRCSSTTALLLKTSRLTAAAAVAAFVVTNPPSAHQQRFLSTDNESNRSKRKSRTLSGDPTTKRPNRLCDPYGQSGKPLTWEQIKPLSPTIHKGWQVEETNDDDVDFVKAGDKEEKEDMSLSSIPASISREFVHPDFLSGTKFLQSMGAVAQMNAHYPSLHLDRRIIKKTWQVVSTVRCQTLVLGGLSTHDFHLAMLVDVEAERPEVKKYLSPHDDE